MARKAPTINDLPAPQQEYLRWLLSKPENREPRTQTELAQKLGVNRRTLQDWRTNPTFHEVHRRMALTVSGGPEHTQFVLDTMRQIVAGGEKDSDRIAAAKVWLSTVRAIEPEPVEEAVPIESLSTEELQARLQAELSKQKVKRGK